jgi:hypothetical protein
MSSEEPPVLVLPEDFDDLTTFLRVSPLISSEQIAEFRARIGGLRG